MGVGGGMGGMGADHSVTFHMTLGKLLFTNPPLSLKLRVLPLSYPQSPRTEIQDIKPPFRLPSAEEEPERRASFSS